MNATSVPPLSRSASRAPWWVTRLERSLAAELIPTFLIGSALYVVLFLFQSLLARGQWLSALPAAQTAKWLGYQIPEFTLRAFPLAIVFAVLMVYGRWARDHELLAAASGGVSLVRLSRPVLAFGALLVVAGLLLAEFVTPNANRAVAVTWWDSVDGGGKAMTRLAGQNIPVGEFTLFFEGFDPSTQEAQNVRLESWRGAVQTIFWAQAAKFEGNNFKMRGYRQYQLDHAQLPLPDGATPEDLRKALLSQIVPVKPDATLTLEFPKSRDDLISANAGGGFEDSRSLSDLISEWRTGGQGAQNAAVQFGFKTAMPWANLAILLLAIPVAASSSRSSSVALGLAVVIAIGYYAALFLGQTLGQNGLMPGPFGPWLANFGFVALGIWAIRQRQVR